MTLPEESLAPPEKQGMWAGAGGDWGSNLGLRRLDRRRTLTYILGCHDLPGTSKPYPFLVPCYLFYT